MASMMAMKMAKMSKDFQEKTGLKDEMLENSFFTKIDEEGTTHFFPSQKLGQNYKNYCTGFQKFIKQEDIVSIVRKYTDSETFYCTKINLLLASDSKEIITIKDYVKQLKWCCGYLSNFNQVLCPEVYRGFDCSEEEYNSYVVGKNLYIPSFLSTSQDKNKFYGTKNCLMVIKFKYKPGSAFVVNSTYSKYADKEEEVLLACWSKFKVLNKQKKKEFNKKVYDYYLELQYLNDRVFISK